jgi:hypothetical protein
MTKILKKLKRSWIKRHPLWLVPTKSDKGHQNYEKYSPSSKSQRNPCAMPRGVLERHWWLGIVEVGIATIAIAI